MNLDNYNTVIFDCDGVILNSNFKKTEAYKMAAIDFGANPDQAKMLVEHHVKNTGISRYVKFEYFLTKILNKPFIEQDFNFLITALNRRVKESLLECEVAEGIDKLRQRYPNQNWMVMSGGDEEEVRELLTQKKVAHFFNLGIFGSPKSKHQILEERLTTSDFEPVIFFGDSKYDIDTAIKYDIDFLFFSGWTDFDGWESYLKDTKFQHRRYLKDL
jgi:phosphoglycolate phosphatase-like HAD superfamily hydrolase